jgi:hypothetical protein
MKKPSNNKKGVYIKLVIFGAIILFAFFSYKYVYASKQTSQKKKAFDTQKQVMVEFWSKEGLSDEEIQLKIEDLRQEKKDSGVGSPRTVIMRVLGEQHSIGR